MTTLIDNVYACKNLYNQLLSPVCKEYDVNVTSIMILLYLADNPGKVTASTIVESQHLTKSLVSMSLKDLIEKGYITCFQAEDDHRQQHLLLNSSANELVEKGKIAQMRFMEILTNGFSKSERENVSKYFQKIEQNISQYAGKDVKENEQPCL